MFEKNQNEKATPTIFFEFLEKVGCGPVDHLIETAIEHFYDIIV
jgi:hypothetical protein